MVQRNLSYGPDAAHKVDVYAATQTDAPLFVFFHGGGLEGGDKGDGKIPNFLTLASRGITVATADYRMYPTARFPEFIEDAALCVAWCMANIPHGEVYVGGASAGSYLAMMLAFDKHYLGAHGIDAADKTVIAGYFCDSGQPTVHFNVLRERGLDTRLIRVDEAAALYFIEQPSNPEALPRYAFTVAEHDMENRVEQNILLCRTMRHLGYPADKIVYTYMNGYGHCAYNGDAVYAEMIETFIQGETRLV